MHRVGSLLVGVAAFCAAFVIVHSGGNESTASRPHRSASGAMEALEFWSRSRAYPDADIPNDKHFAAFQVSKRRFRKEPQAFAAAGPGWRYIGPENLSGRMISVALNPLNPSTIYAGSASGGLWRSHTGGVAGDWERIATGYPVLGVGAIAISPSDSNVLYIGTGEVYRYQGSAGGLVIRTTRGSYGMGILKSTDGGASWMKSLDWSYYQQRGVQSIKINPSNPNTVWAATTDGIYKSTDAGGSWTETFLIFMAQDIVIHATDTNRVMISTGNLDLTPGIFRTSDGGANWEQVNPISFTGKTLLDSPPTSPDLVYASIADSTTGVGSVWRSADFGGSWTEVINSSSQPIFGVQGWYSHYVAVHPSSLNLVFHASVSAKYSINGGTSFSSTGGLYSDNHDFAYDPADPDILYSANDDGIYRSTNFGATFTHVSEGLGTGQLYNGFSSSQNDSLIALTQSQDHIPGYIYQGTGIWPPSAIDESGWTAIDPVNDSLMYAINRFGGSVRRSTNRGASFGGAVGLGTAGAWNTPIAVAPSAPSILYAAKTKVFKSSNAALSWSVTNGNLNLDGNPSISIAVAPSSADTVFVGTAPTITTAHVFRTTDGGVSWTNVTGSLPDRYPLDLAVDPNNSQVAYAAFGGYGTGHVFKTTNAGGSWTNISGALPDIPATALLVDPQNSAAVYLGTDIGVYVSTDAGGSWNAFNDGLIDAVLVSDLSMTASNRVIRVATHGNGAFERRMPESFPMISSVSPSGGEVWEVGSVHTISWEQALVPSVGLDFSTNNGATWTLIAEGVSNAPGGYPWTVPPALTSAARVRVRSASDSATSAQSAGPFTIYIDGAIIPVLTSWNLVSLPVAVADHSKESLFPGASSGVFSYGTSYALVDSVGEGLGYWIKYPKDTILALEGTPITADSVGVHQGWNLVGSLTEPLAAAAVTSDPPGLVTSLFYGYDGSYAAADSLRPGHGYWVKCAGPGMLHRSTGASAKSNGTVPPLASLDRLGTLSVTSADGRSQTLYFGEHYAQASGAFFEMPPPAPSGSFDARFASNLIAEFFVDGAPRTVPILLSGCVYPLTLAWSSPAGTGTVALAAGGETIRLAGSGSLVVSRAHAVLALVSGADAAATGLAHEFRLLQNYPNPFNPTTTLRYELAADGGVQLTVYTLAGEEVARLADGRKTAGSHEIRWDARGLPSGIYIARLAAGDRTSTRKLVLLK